MLANNLHAAEILLQENNYLISLPEVCIKLKETLADPFHTNQDISQVIMFDPGLTTRLLRIVNSSYYGLVMPTSDIPHALSIMGEQDLNNLIIVTAIIQSLNSVESEMDIEQFWKSSFFCAVTARNLAKECQSKIKEETFIAGLLLNVGKFLIYHHEPELLQAVTEEVINTERKDYIVEKELLGFDHCDVGSVMCKAWNFSETLTQTIANHHTQPEQNIDSMSQLIIYLANSCCEKLEKNLNEGLPPEDMCLDQIPTLPLIGIEKARFIEILEQSYQEYFQAYESFCGQ